MTLSNPPHRNDTYALILLGLFIAFFIAMAIEPLDRHDWMLENTLPLLAIPLLIWHHRRQPFSNFAYGALFAFMILHEIGAHYTYAKVPYDEWFRSLTGTTLNELLGLERNHFDRLVHFLYGLLLFPIFWELFAANVQARGLWRYLVPATFMFSHAGIYECVEWAAAAMFGGDLGVTYLGTQGDEWDAQKDMALAMLGTVVAVIILLLHEQRAARLPTASAVHTAQHRDTTG